MRTGRALFDPTDVQCGRGEVDLVPAQVCQLAGPEAVAIGHKDHRGIPVCPPVFLGGREQALDLGLGQVFAGPQVRVGAALGGNCWFFGGWRDQPEVGFGQGFHPLWRMLFG